MNDKKYMKIALEEAKLAAHYNEVPIGAVIVQVKPDGSETIICQKHNMKESTNSPSAHAEFLAIENAAKILNRWRLSDCVVYVTLEPCIMCAGLMHQARISRCVFGAFDKKAGALNSLYQINKDTRLNHNFKADGGILENDCKKLLQNFFKKKRILNKH